jgi:hypothetical protein
MTESATMPPEAGDPQNVIHRMRYAKAAHGHPGPYELRVTSAVAKMASTGELHCPADVLLVVDDNAVMPDPPPPEKKPFAQRLDQYGKWRDKTNMDRFVILVFLTAEEKEAFCRQQLGAPDVDYVDGAEVASLTMKKAEVA